MNEYREILVRLCQLVGFPAPLPEQGLSEWSDESVDSLLPPRGGPFWREARIHTIAAFAASVVKDEIGCTEHLTKARDVVAVHGRRACACAHTVIPFEDLGRKICRVCFGRVT